MLADPYRNRFACPSIDLFFHLLSACSSFFDSMRGLNKEEAALLRLDCP